MNDPALSISDGQVRGDTVGSALVLTIDAPSTKNACTVEMREQMLDHLNDASHSSDCRYIVITGARGQFCSGGRVHGNLSPDEERTRRTVKLFQEIVRTLHTGPKPTIAALEGVAFGAGLSLAVACDYIVAGQSTRLCASFGRVGLMADAGLAWTLPSRIGAGAARDLLLSARQLTAQEASRFGLVNEVVADGSALETALSVGERYLDVAPLSIAATKRVLSQGLSSLEDVFAAELDEQVKLSFSADYVEGRAAFGERRRPDFKGR